METQATDIYIYNQASEETYLRSRSHHVDGLPRRLIIISTVIIITIITWPCLVNGLYGSADLTFSFCEHLFIHLDFEAKYDHQEKVR